MPAWADGEPPRWYHLEETLFVNYGAAEGLPRGAVSSVALDARGLVWLATSDGLVRWDGHEARQVPAGVLAAAGDVREIAAGPGGIFWLGTASGLFRFDPVAESAERVEAAGDASIHDIAFQDGEAGTAWLAAESGVLALDLANHEVRTWLDELDGRVFDVLVDESDTVWAGTEKGLYRKPAAEETFEAFSLGADVPQETRIASLLLTGGGEVWVGTARRGVFRLAGEGDVQPVALPDFEQDWIYAMEEIRPGVVWLGTFGEGLIEVRADSGVARRIRPNRLVPQSLPDGRVWTVHRDRDGRVWVGTYRGVSMHDPDPRAVTTVFGDVGHPAGLRGQNVKSVLEGRDGTIWLGYADAGVDGVSPGGGRVRAVEPDAESPATALPGGAVETLVHGPDEALLLGTNWGLYRYRDGKTARLAVPGGPGEGYVGTLLAADGAVWAGGTGGLWRLEPGPGGWRARALAEGLTDQRVSQLAARPEGGVVAGTWQGLNWLDAEGRVEQNTADANGPASPLAGAYIATLRYDDQGRLWVGTSGRGLFRLDGAGGVLRLGRADGLPSDSIKSLEFDDAGRAWVATDAGLAVVDPDGPAVHPLTRRDGAVIETYSRNASLRTGPGELLFGGEGGLTVVRPDAWQPRAHAAPLAIVAVSVGDRPRADPLAGLEAERPVVVLPEHNALSIAFAALDYAAGEPYPYRYRLADYETEWRHADGGRRLASYTSLPPGDYRFLVQGGDGSGGWADSGAALHARVLPFWSQTTWARGSMAVLALCLVWLVFRWRTGHLRRRQQHLERVVGERTSELEASGEALRQKTRELEEVSITDALTGLRNRRFVDEHLDQDAAQVIRRYRDGGRNAHTPPDMLLFLVDFDNFKRINDVHGHAAGDAVLVEMRHRLERVFRETDYLVRWGGEEFLVVARNTARDHAEDLAERLRQEVRGQPFDTGTGQQEQMTCSVGVVPFPFDAERPEALDWPECLEIADRCLYTAKHAGRDAWLLARRGDAPMDEISTESLRNRFWELVEEGVIDLSSNLTPDRIRQAGKIST